MFSSKRVKAKTLLVFVTITTLMSALSGCSVLSQILGKGSGPGATAPGTFTISGTVTASGSPSQGVSVSDGSSTVTTDSNGAFSFTGLSAGIYTLTASYTQATFSPPSQKVTVMGTDVKGVTFEAATESGAPLPPAIPRALGYLDPPPSTSEVILISAKPLTVDFDTRLDMAYGPYTTTILSHLQLWDSVYGPNYDDPCIDDKVVTLVDSSGNIVKNPQVDAQQHFASSCTTASVPTPTTVLPLSQKPILELTEYWQQLYYHGYAQSTKNQWQQTVSYGETSTQTQSLTATVGVSATASVNGVFAKASATVSASISKTVSNSLSIQQQTSYSTTFAIDPPAGKNAEYSKWQLVYVLRLAKYDPGAAGADQFGYVAFTDPNMSFEYNDQPYDPQWVMPVNSIQDVVNLFNAP